jgi:isoquinoline 1-oxidoreductase
MSSVRKTQLEIEMQQQEVVGSLCRSHELPKDISAWLHIAEDGKVTVFTGKVEVGQNIRTSLAQQVAEELRFPMGSISLIMGNTDRVPWDGAASAGSCAKWMAPCPRSIFPS